MPRFSKNNSEELRELLYNSYVHDAKIENIEYKHGKDSLEIELINTIFNFKINLTFNNIEIALIVKGEEYGNRDTIISLTSEEDFSYLQTYLPQYNERVENYLYLLFQMFSGDEIHIVSKEVIMETMGRF